MRYRSFTIPISFTHLLSDEVSQKLEQKKKNFKSVHFTWLFQNPYHLCLQFSNALFPTVVIFVFFMNSFAFYFLFRSLVNYNHFCWTGLTYFAFHSLFFLNFDSILPIEAYICHLKYVWKNILSTNYQHRQPTDKFKVFLPFDFETQTFEHKKKKL